MILEKLKERLAKIGLDGSIYGQRTRKCILSRLPLDMERVPWYEHAYFIPEDFKVRNEFVFDPVSLVPCLALAPEKSDRILDMCAAPGTKTFILSFLTDNEARITANDISYQRAKRLRFNVDKFGLSAEIMNKSGRKISGEFDKILLDAPCSGEGMVNKHEKIFSHWSEKSVRLLSKKQKKLVARAFELLAANGTLVYSTCTFEPEENEEVVDSLLEKFPDASMEDIETVINHAKGIAKWDGRIYDERVKKCMRIYPQHNGTGGFFVAKIRKTSFS